MHLTCHTIFIIHVCSRISLCLSQSLPHTPPPSISPSLYVLALAMFSRSPSAYHAVRSLGILQLPCDRTLRGYMYRHASSPGINEEALLDRAPKYDNFKEERLAAGFARPIGEEILIWDEVKVSMRTECNNVTLANMGWSQGQYAYWMQCYVSVTNFIGAVTNHLCNALYGLLVCWVIISLYMNCGQTGLSGFTVWYVLCMHVLCSQSDVEFCERYLCSVIVWSWNEKIINLLIPLKTQGVTVGDPAT